MKYQFVLKQTHEYVLEVDLNERQKRALDNGADITTLFAKAWREMHSETIDGVLQYDDANMNDFVSNITEKVVNINHIK